MMMTIGNMMISLYFLICRHYGQMLSDIFSSALFNAIDGRNFADGWRKMTELFAIIYIRVIIGER